MALAVHEWGPPDGRSVVFWHALGPDPSGLDLGPVAGRLAAAGFRVVAVDGPGFGDSPLLPAEGYALGALVGELHQVIASHDLEPFVAMGHSWGGSIAVRYAAAHPRLVTAVVLLDSGHIDYRDLPDVDADRPVAEWVEDARRRDGRRAEARGRAMAGLAGRVSDGWPALVEHRIPTLLYLATEPPHGLQNREHVGRFADAVPHAEIRWAANAGHGILADVGPPLGDEIAVWLTEHA